MESDAKKLVQELLLGRFDNEIADIANAVQERIQNGTSDMGWRLTVGDLSVRFDDLTLSEAEAIEKETGAPWVALAPSMWVRDFRVIVQVCGFSRCGWDADAADAAVPATALDRTACVDWVQVERAPLAVAPSGASDPTSSNAPDASDGHGK